MGRTYPEANLAAESAYWDGASHEGPLNDTAVAAKNPYEEKNGLDTPAKKSVQTAKETPTKEMLPMKHTTKFPPTPNLLCPMGEESGMTAPRPLEGLGSIPTPPAGFAPDYFVNEFADEPVREYSGHSAPDIERPGYRLQRTWTPEEGVCVFIDHLTDEAFTIPEICDLITTLTGALDFLADGSPSPTAPEGFNLAEGCSDHWIGASTMNPSFSVTPAWNATTGTHSAELWTTNHEMRDYAALTPAEAIQPATDLIAAATTSLGGKN